MCLTPKESAKIADKDIVVYKVLLKYSDETYHSPFDGAQKYLDKEIVIKKFNIQYDSQNQPIDTTYIFKYNR